ncbi:MAG: hypothetical protein H7A50_13155 [Akkermansiaceae bacterium]|nr:hypothetical protein [Akkermansiaceae bacterium]
MDLKPWKIGIPHEAMPAITVIWFLLWMLAIPALAFNFVALALLARKQPRFVTPALLVLIALVAISTSAVIYWRAAALGIVAVPGSAGQSRPMQVN